ncbi:GNAT family N-acetyltransferase [Metabacillus fastidiosus]|uniref:GNAT family N-acetyltransferase n=1 Tax=Metabacillus fastidiosus TaxID=1458 RepID=UPI003D2C552E
MFKEEKVADYDFESYDSEIEKNIAFRELTINEDIERLHRWHHQEHVKPFWNLNISFEHYQRHLKKMLKDSHQTLYIGHLDDVPMSYWETYWVNEDIVGKHYEYEEADQGIHLLIGAEEYLGKGYALPMLKAIVSFQFQQKQTKKVIAEPDIRNDKMIHIFKKCGFKPVKTIDLPDKQGLLMFCEREEFEKGGSNNAKSSQS